MKSISEELANYRSILSESVVSEKWDTKMKTPEAKKGMFKDKTKAELKSELAAAKARSKKIHDAGKKEPESLKTKIKELEFALRAKNKFGKVSESTSNKYCNSCGKLKTEPSKHPNYHDKCFDSTMVLASDNNTNYRSAVGKYYTTSPETLAKMKDKSDKVSESLNKPWTCPECEGHNFVHMKTCKHCGEARPKDQVKEGYGDEFQDHSFEDFGDEDGDNCVNCGHSYVKHDSDGYCIICNEPCYEPESTGDVNDSWERANMFSESKNRKHVKESEETYILGREANNLRGTPEEDWGKAMFVKDMSSYTLLPCNATMLSRAEIMEFVKKFAFKAAYFPYPNNELFGDGTKPIEWDRIKNQAIPLNKPTFPKDKWDWSEDKVAESVKLNTKPGPWSSKKLNENKVSKKYTRMMDNGCPKCKSVDVNNTEANLKGVGKSDKVPVAMCDECGHTEQKYQ